MKRTLAILWRNPGIGEWDPVYDLVWRSAFPDHGSHRVSDWAIAALVDSRPWKSMELSASRLLLACLEALAPKEARR